MNLTQSTSVVYIMLPSLVKNAQGCDRPNTVGLLKQQLCSTPRKCISETKKLVLADIQIREISELKKQLASLNCKCTQCIGLRNKMNKKEDLETGRTKNQDDDLVLCPECKSLLKGNKNAGRPGTNATSQTDFLAKGLNKNTKDFNGATEGTGFSKVTVGTNPNPSFSRKKGSYNSVTRPPKLNSAENSKHKCGKKSKPCYIIVPKGAGNFTPICPTKKKCKGKTIFQKRDHISDVINSIRLPI